MSSINFEELTRRLQDFDKKAAAKEAAGPQRAKPASTGMSRQEYERLPAVQKVRAKKAAEASDANAFRIQQKVMALAEAALEAYNDPDNEREVQGEDEWDVAYVNPKFETIIAQLAALGQPAMPAFEVLAEELGEDPVREAVELYVHHAGMKATVDYQREAQRLELMEREEAAKLELRMAELIKLNPQFDPEHPDLVAEMEHVLRQAKSAEVESEKRAFIAAYKDLEVEQYRRAEAYRTAEETFWQVVTEEGLESFDEGERKYIAALQLGDAKYIADKQADARTARIQADADQAGIGTDSRDQDGRFVLTDGSKTLYVSDDGVAAALATGFQFIRDFQAPVEADYVGAINPEPTVAEAAERFAVEQTARDHEAEAIAAKNTFQAEVERMSKDAADAQEQRAATDNQKRLAEMNQLGVSEDTPPAPDPFAGGRS